jgi:argininosuccinate lyase
VSGGATGEGRLWGARFAGGPEASAWALGVSTGFDLRLWRQDLAGSRVHAAELARVGILADDERDRIVAALDRCAALFEAGEFPLEPTDEDLHGAVERWLVEELGDLGGRLRAGRSRNDQIVSDVRLWARDACDRMLGDVATLQRALIEQAERHLDWIAPGYTHLQRAQPVLLGHHLLAWVWMLERDGERIRGARGHLDRSVLGSGALAGQTLGLDPSRYAAGLGMGAPLENSLDAVASRDAVLELVAALAILAVTLSRLGEELVLWTTAEFGFARFGDAFSTGSSMMPQKRNPDVAELVRGKSGRVVGDLMALLTLVKGLPMTYDRDLQEDKEPLFDAVDTLALVLPALAGAVGSLSFDRDRLAAAADDPAALATDVAEDLVRRGMPFRAAHEAVGGLVRAAEERGTDLRGLPAELLAAVHPDLPAAWAGLLDPRAATERRGAPNATAAASVRAQLALARDRVGRPDGVV